MRNGALKKEYTLVRSDRRTLGLEITREGGLIVRAPRNFPQRDIDRFILSRAGWILEHTELQKKRLAAHPEPDDKLRAELIAKAKAALPARVKFWAGRMGLAPAGITITGARGRFGSCSPKNRLCFSWRLMQFPDAAVDYVVVHELAHIVHRNHGKQFYALIAEYLPDWKARRDLLKPKI